MIADRTDKGFAALLPATQEEEIAAFVRRFLTSFGATLKECGPSLLEAELPAELARRLAVNRFVKLRFTPVDSSRRDPSQEKVDGGGEYVTFGHPILDRMLELAKNRGLTAGLLFSSSLDPDFVQAIHQCHPFSAKIGPGRNGAPLQDGGGAAEGEPAEGSETGRGDAHKGARLHKAMGSDRDGDSIVMGTEIRALLRVTAKVHFANARVRVADRRLVHQTQLLFHFKVSFVSDEKRERVIPLLIDPVTEKIDRLVDVTAAVSFTPHREGDDRGKAYTLSRLYRKACDHLERRVAHMADGFERNVARRMERDLDRIEEYYRGLTEERVEPLRKVFRRMAAAGVRADLARSWQTETRFREQRDMMKEEAGALEAVYEREIAALNKEREQRVEEVREKYHPRAEVQLTHAAFVMVPRVEWRLKLSGTARREAVLLYDVLRRRLVDWDCEACGRPFLGPVYLCPCDALTCDQCRRRCDECGDEVCSQCAEGTCHVCGGLLCRTCDAACPQSDSHPELSLPTVCSRCRLETCPGCIGMFRFQLESAF